MKTLARLYLWSFITGLVLWAFTMSVVCGLGGCDSHAQTVDVDASATPLPAGIVLPTNPLDGLNWMPIEGKNLTAEEWKRLVSTDPVLQFMERVNDRAVKSPEWHKDFRAAHYRAFTEEITKYIVETYQINSVEMK